MNRRVILPLYYLIQLTWGIPQNALGLLFCLLLFIIDRHRPWGRYHGAFVIRTRLRSSAGVGMFIFLGKMDPRHVPHVLAHEYGHTIQSCILGPLYLLIIGLPSLCWANVPALRRWRHRTHTRYTSFYPESWANRLGKRYTGEEPIRN